MRDSQRPKRRKPALDTTPPSSTSAQPRMVPLMNDGWGYAEHVDLGSPRPR